MAAGCAPIREPNMSLSPLNVFPRSPRGSALIIATALILLLAGLSTILMNEMATRSLRTQVAEEDLLAFEAAEAGIDAALNDINQTPTIPLVQNGVQVFTNDGRPIYVHDPTFKPGCLGTKNWNHASGSPVLADGITPNPDYQPNDNVLPAGPRYAT